MFVKSGLKSHIFVKQVARNIDPCLFSSATRHTFVRPKNTLQAFKSRYDNQTFTTNAAISISIAVQSSLYLYWVFLKAI